MTISLAAALALGAGCGNYSNEDLEFMNAVPDRQDLSVDLPARSAALAPADEAELAKATHDTIKLFNGIMFEILGGVEAIRAYQPTSRTPDGRTWGPIPDENHPGWQWEFRMTRLPDLTFDYVFELQPVGAVPDVWIPFVTGRFEPSPGVRRGVGDFHVVTDPLRAAGYPFDVEGQKLRTVDVSYSTKDYPISVIVDFVSFPNLADLSMTNSVHYEYGVQSDGQGAMKFTLTGDLITTTTAIEVVAVTSRWLLTGAGRADLTVQQGDGAGLMQTECWDDSFNATYNDKPWSPAEDVPTGGQGDPTALCPAIPTI